MMKALLLFLFAVTAYAEQLDGLLNVLPADALLSSLMDADAKVLSEADGFDATKKLPEAEKFMGKPGVVGTPVPDYSGKAVKKAALKAVPMKKAVVKKAVAKKLAVPKLKSAAVLKKKPKVHHLKPIIHVIEKPVPVYHKVPVGKKVLVPKFYPVFKKIPVPKIVPVPYKVPVKKIIPKIVKIPKAIPIPKIVPMKKPVPIPIPYPVPKYHRFPVPKPVPYKKYIPIPIPKKVPKFIPVPVKKIIKVPKPYYVPIKVPHITTSYVKTPMVVNVPDIKKEGKFKKTNIDFKSEGGKEDKFLESVLGNMKGGERFDESMINLVSEDKELMKLLANMPGEAPKM